jgi:hypothetical protein
MRDCDIAVSGYLLRRLKAAADILALPNAESVVELWCTEKLDQMPEVGQLIHDQQIASRKIREQWIARNEQPRP